MTRCIGCKQKQKSFWCIECETVYQTLTSELRDIMGYLGENQSEGHLVLTASEILEFERLMGSTPLGKAAIMNRAAELLMEVEDFFIHTPMCPGCKKHKLELRVGEPLEATCTGGCRL